MSGDLVFARATINLPGLRAGSEANVDPENPYIADCLRAGWLVPVEEEDDGMTESSEHDAEPEPGDDQLPVDDDDGSEDGDDTVHAGEEEAE